MRRRRDKPGRKIVLNPNACLEKLTERGTFGNVEKTSTNLFIAVLLEVAES